MIGRHLKILGLSLLALVGVMAVSASAAQAKWLVLDGAGKSVATLQLTGEVLLSEFLVQTIKGFEIHCPKGTAAVTLETIESAKNLKGEGTATFKECVVLKAEKTCTVKSPGAGAAGEVIAKGTGKGEMTGPKTTDVFSKLSSEEFTTLSISGALCPLDGQEETVNGTAKLTLNTATELATSHTATLLGEALKFGSEAAILHGELIKPGEHATAVTIDNVKAASGNQWAIELVEL